MLDDQLINPEEIDQQSQDVNADIQMKSDKSHHS